MAWLRLDDGFTKHPKFSGWTVREKWAWLEVMEYCARYSTGGVIPNDLSIMPRSTTQELLGKAIASGWIDEIADESATDREQIVSGKGGRSSTDRERNEGSFVNGSSTLVIHDWEQYNPAEPLEERVRKALEEHPEASANEIASIVKGRKKAILAVVKRFRSGSPEQPDVVPADGSASVPDEDAEPDVTGSPAVPESVTRADICARAGVTRPVPSLEDEEPVDEPALQFDSSTPTNNGDVETFPVVGAEEVLRGL